VFLSTDPVKNIGAGWRPMAYAYAGGNPVTKMDPQGLFAVHGYYCGPNHTGGNQGTFGDLSDDQIASLPAPIDFLDAACFFHDVYHEQQRQADESTLLGDYALGLAGLVAAVMPDKISVTDGGGIFGSGVSSRKLAGKGIAVAFLSGTATAVTGLERMAQQPQAKASGSPYGLPSSSFQAPYQTRGTDVNFGQTSFAAMTPAAGAYAEQNNSFFATVPQSAVMHAGTTSGGSGGGSSEGTGSSSKSSFSQSVERISSTVSATVNKVTTAVKEAAASAKQSVTSAVNKAVSAVKSFFSKGKKK